MKEMTMVTITEFIKEEVVDNTKEIILRRIKEGLQSEKVFDEIVFNRYSVEFHFKENKVVINDDIFLDTPPLILSIQSFVKELSATK